MNDWPEVTVNKFRLFPAAAYFIAAYFIVCIMLSTVSPAVQQKKPSLYVGSKTCEPCHQEEYASFIKYAKKSRSFQSIERLKKGLSQQDLKKCYSCHTTGYGKPGGFISVEETPELKNAGCEVCHGPGELHVKTENTDAIKRKLTREDCEACHISERVKAFRYKPLIHGGGH